MNEIIGTFLIGVGCGIMIEWTLFVIHLVRNSEAKTESSK